MDPPAPSLIRAARFVTAGTGRETGFRLRRGSPLQSLAHFQIEHVPGQRPAFVLGEVGELHHRGAGDTLSEGFEDLADAGSLTELLGAEIARPGIEPGRGGPVARASLAMTGDAVDGVG